MSLNYKEIQLILSEVNLEGAKIQAVVQSSFHSITWELYDRQNGRFAWYTEIGTQQSRLHLLNPNAKIAKTKKLQRFEQYARKNLEGSVITKCYQLPFDRAVVWELNNHDRLLKVYFRFYSGPGANIIVTDQNNVIQDLLLRRPGRDEMSSMVLKTEERTQSDKVFEVRTWDGDSFNSFIERTCAQEQALDLYSQLYKQVQTRMEQQLGRLSTSIRSAEKSIQANSDYEELRYIADLLSANSYQIVRGQDKVVLTDWNNGGSTLTVQLDKSLSPGANLQA